MTDENNMSTDPNDPEGFDDCDPTVFNLNPTINVAPAKLPDSWAITSFFALVLVAGFSFYLGLSLNENKYKADNQTLGTQLSATTNQLVTEQRATALRLEVLNTCVTGGLIPIFVNGNIDCKGVK